MVLLVGVGGYGWYATNAIYLGTFTSIEITNITVFGGSGESLMPYYNNSNYDNNGITLWSEMSFIGLRFSNLEIVGKLPVNTAINVKATVKR